VLYTYRATVLQVVDGDTVDLSVSLGFDVSHRARFRLTGIDAPESYGPNASDAGRAAKQQLADTLRVGSTVVVKTTKDRREKYGRFLAEVFLVTADGSPMEISVNQMMVDAGHATPYAGGSR
jgi:micrococcal nuclease